MKKYLLIPFTATLLAINLLNAGCVSPNTTVVLVEDPYGKVGKVVVENDQNKIEELTVKNMAVRVSETKSTTKQLSQQQVDQTFAGILKSEPLAPIRIKLHFDSGSSVVLAEDLPLLDKALAEITARQSCDISIIGNSDSEGDYESNKKLSLERAEVVSKLVLSKNIEPRCIDLRFYADNDPIVPTAKGQGHPLNRRVEIEIR